MGNKAVFHRIPVNVITVLFKIPIVTDLMFPIAALPAGLFTFYAAGRIRYGFVSVGAMQGEVPFDEHPAGRVVHVTRRQGPDAMQVIRK